MKASKFTRRCGLSVPLQFSYGLPSGPPSFGGWSCGGLSGIDGRTNKGPTLVPGLSVSTV